MGYGANRTYFLLYNFTHFEIIRLAKETDASLVSIGFVSIQSFPAGQFILINCNVPMFISVSVDEATEAERVSAGSIPV
jgi:hypothetical protein